MAKKAKLDKAKNDEVKEADSKPVADAPPVERGDLKLSFPSFRVSPENDEQGLWFRWRLAAIESEGELAPNAIVSAGCTEVVECTSGDLGFDAAVRGVPLSADFVNSALTAARSGSNEAYEIVVEAYRGEYGNAEEDELVGKSSIGLIPLMSNVQEPLQVDLRLCESAESDADESKDSTMLNSLVLSIRIEALGKLYDYWTNGAVLACDKVSLRDLPEEWSARFREGETTGVALKLGNSALLCNGKLVLEASTSVEDVVDAAETAESPEASTEAPSEPAVWQVRLTAEEEEGQGLGQQQYVFLSPLDVQELREAGRAMLSVVVDAPPAEDARLELVAAGLASSAPFLQPGEARAIMTADLDIKNVPVLSEEETTDEGERKQVEEESVGAKCSLTVQMTLARALVPAPPVPKPRLANVRDLVEGRPARRMRRPSALEMLDEAAAEIVDRVTSVYGETKSEEERERAHLLHNLNVNGHYQRMRLALKEALSKFVTSERLGEFAGLDGDVLYCAVFERALALLNQTFNDKVEAAKRGQTSLKAKPTPARRLAELQERLTNLLARAYDLESAGLLAEAEEVFQERVGDAEKTALMDGEQDLPVDPIVWFEYADFCLRNGEERRAVAAECLRSALAIDDGHVSSLVAYGAVLMDSGSDAQAETFLVRAVEAGLPTGASVRAMRDIVTAHGLLQLMTERRADSQPPPSFVAASLGWPAETDNDDDVKSRAALCLQACASCLSWRLERVSARLLGAFKEGLAAMQTTLTPLEETETLFADRLLEGWLRGDVQEIESAIEVHDVPASGFLLLGRLLKGAEEDTEGSSTSADVKQASTLRKLALEQAFTRLQDAFDPENESEEAEELTDMWRIDLDEAIVRESVLQLGKMYLAERAAGAAKRVFLFACARWPSPDSWAGAGEACIMGRAFTDAIDVLSEANLMDRAAPRIWALLSLSCLHAGMKELAQRAFVHAAGLSDMDLWADLGKQFFENGDLERAATAFRARADLGAPQIPEFARVLLLQNKFEEASTLVDALATNEDVDDVEIVSLRELMAKLVVQGTV